MTTTDTKEFFVFGFVFVFCIFFLFFNIELKQTLKLDFLLYYETDNKTDLSTTHFVLGDGSDVSGNYISQLNNNESDSDLSSLSHVDAPNDTIYMVCGVVIAMLLVGLIIILVAVTINKLRKREESSSPSPTALEAQQQYTLQTRFSSLDSTNCGREHLHQEQQLFNTTPSIIASALTEGNGHLNNSNNNNNNNNNSNNNNNNNHHHLHHPHNGIVFEEPDSVTFVRTSGVTTNGWIFPPKAPTPNIYNCINHDLLTAANHQNGFKGFRKQFSGRFKRLVSKKSESTSPIPPELRPQLKTIYVY